jgi:hypothetical protein
MNIKARFIIGFVFFLVTVFGFWVYGLDFGVRGGDLLSCYASSLVALVVGLTCPLFDKGQP